MVEFAAQNDILKIFTIEMEMKKILCVGGRGGGGAGGRANNYVNCGHHGRLLKKIFRRLKSSKTARKT